MDENVQVESKGSVYTRQSEKQAPVVIEWQGQQKHF